MIGVVRIQRLTTCAFMIRLTTCAFMIRLISTEERYPRQPFHHKEAIDCSAKQDGERRLPGVTTTTAFRDRCSVGGRKVQSPARSQETVKMRGGAGTNDFLSPRTTYMILGKRESLSSSLPSERYQS